MRDQNDRPFRPLTTNERDVVQRLLEPRFPGRDELRAQLDVATARETDDDGCIELACEGVPPAPVKWRIPAEGECPYGEGDIIYVLLYVENGFMSSLEIYTAGGTPWSGLPAAGDLKLFAPYSEDAGVWSRSDKFPR
jgi:hypothetical protein